MCLAEDEPPPRGEKMRSPRADLAGAIEHARISLVCGVCLVPFFPPKPRGPCVFVVSARDDVRLIPHLITDVLKVL